MQRFTKGWRGSTVCTLVAAVVSLGSAPPQGLAQSFPSKPIRIVIGAGVSTPSDILSRVLATELTNSEKWTVVVENRPGASQVIGGTEVFKSPPDGHTIFNSGLPIAAAPALQSKIPFDLLKDFQSVIQIARSYNVLVVTPSLDAKSLPDLVTLLKAHVPYVQFPQSIADLLNGTNHYTFITTLPVMGLINEGKLRPLAVTAPARLPALKDVPTVAEQGYPGLTVADWSGMMVRIETPATIVAQLNAALNRALQQPTVKEAFVRVAAEPVGGAPDVFAKQLREDVERWGKVISSAGIKPK